LIGAWGELAFDNDTANDWAYDLADARDLSLVESTFGELEAVGSGYLDQDVACCALAACEVVARLQGHRGYTNAYTANVDRWVAEHPMYRNWKGWSHTVSVSIGKGRRVSEERPLSA
jgi:Domain of unknown function (DUF4259)